MTTDNIFQQNPAEGDNQQQQTGLLTALVGEGQKYKSAEELAKAYVNADEFIQTLKAENAKLRESSTVTKTVDDILERLNAQQSGTKGDKPEVSVADIEKIVQSTVEGREAEKIRKSNLDKADKLMKEKFGEKAAEVFASKAVDPSVKKTLMELAAVSPDAFLNVFQGTAPTNTLSMDTSSVNTAALSQTATRTTQEGTKEWAAKVRKENPQLYWSQDFQTKLQSLVISNPSRYFGN